MILYIIIIVNKAWMAWKRMSGVYYKRMSLKIVGKINKTGIEKEREKKA